MRRVHVMIWTMGVLGVLASWPTQAVVGQEMALAARRPRFLYRPAIGAMPVEIDAGRNAVLRRVVSLQVEQPTIGRLLAAIERQTGLRFAYDTDFPTNRAITLRADSITVAAALSGILLDTGVDVVLSRRGEVALVKVGRQAVEVQRGTIVGRVTDAKTQTALAGATVVVQGTSRSTTTGNDGRYRIADMAPGTYTVRARYIGYAPGTASVTVSADQEATADFTLEKAAQQLNEVVTTGTVVPTEVKALPTPVSVITDSEITLQRPHTVVELLRQLVPTLVGFDFAAYPYETTLSVRGASSLTGGGHIKIFVDGIEAATNSSTAVNPNSIERIEVIRGPEAAAIYGSDASGGVMQIFTKRGDPNLTRPRIDVQAIAGLVQTPYSGYGTVLRQTYAADVRGGSGDASYNLGGGYTRTGNWLPNQANTTQSSPNLYGGMHYARGMVGLDIFARHEQYNAPQVYNPVLAGTGLASYMKPIYQDLPFWGQTIGAHVNVTPTRWWQHTITIGFDRFSYDRHQTQPVLSAPDDTLLQVDDEEGIKNSIRYNTSVQGSLGGGLTGSLMAGVDHYSYRDNEFYTDGATIITGTIQTDPNQPVKGIRNITNNTGYFVQTQLGFRDALFLTTGVRAEQNTNFGDSLGTPVSPRVGLSYVQPVGGATLKVRGSWGRAIRAPSPQLASGFGTAVLRNLRLGPERQRGVDAGVDLVFGTQASLSATYFDQTAENLIQRVQVRVAPVPQYQYQNVGRVKNTGVELEGMINVGSLNLKAQYGYARARVEQLSPNYTGVLQPGDQTLQTPHHTAGASLTVAPLSGTTIAAGLTYVGSWQNYDYLALLGCDGGTSPCQASARDYIVAYPSFVKLNATVSQQLTRLVSGFISVDNLTNNQAYESENFEPVMGRITNIGLNFHY